METTNRERDLLIEWITIIEMISKDNLKQLTNIEVENRYNLALLLMEDELSK